MTDAPIEVGLAQRPLPGESESGDRCVVKVLGKYALVGVIDGLGHGAEAAQAAAVAAEVLEASAREPVSLLLERCHERLRGTRGAAITLIAVDREDELLKWVGAGSVAAALLHPEASGKLRCKELLVRGGVAGAALPSVEASSIGIGHGDMVVIATDGLRADFVEGITRTGPPQELANQLLQRYQTTHDDALVLVMRITKECP